MVMALDASLTPAKAPCNENAIFSHGVGLDLFCSSSWDLIHLVVEQTLPLQNGNCWHASASWWAMKLRSFAADVLPCTTAGEITFY